MSKVKLTKYDIEYRLRVARLGKRIWIKVRDIQNVKTDKPEALAEIKSRICEKLEVDTDIHLVNNCSACTIFYNDGRNCQRRCRLKTECRSFCNNAREVNPIIIHSVAIVMIQIHDVWITELMNDLDKAK